jgi:hypothetical protein
MRTSPLAKIKARLVEQSRKIEHLKEQLASAQAGSLFDLKRDTAADIGRVIADSISEGRWRNIKKAADERYKARSKPAG